MTTQRNPHYAKFLLAVAIEPEEIGRRIKAARDHKGWTQLDFAREANVSPSSVQRWEGGRLPPVRELMRLADVLGVDPDQLVENGGNGVLSEEDMLRRVVREELAVVLDALLKPLRRLEERGQEPPTQAGSPEVPQ